MSEVVLRVQALGLRRGMRGVLEGVTFDVPRGELVALMGPSGSGKTTILRAVAGLEPFQSGTVQVEDLVMDSGAWLTPATLRALRRKVGMVFQFHHLFEHLPAIKNVWLAPVHAYGVPLREAERRARELLAASVWSIARPRCRASCRVARRSGSPSPGPSPSIRRFCSWTSRQRRWIRRGAWSSAICCGDCSAMAAHLS